MKKTWQCPKCESAKVGYFETLPDGAPGAPSTEQVVGDLAVDTLFGLVATQRAGPVEAFVCTECGFFEEYVKNPESVPWQSLRNLRWCRR